MSKKIDNHFNAFENSTVKTKKYIVLNEARKRPVYQTFCVSLTISQSSSEHKRFQKAFVITFTYLDCSIMLLKAGNYIQSVSQIIS